VSTQVCPRKVNGVDVNFKGMQLQFWKPTTGAFQVRHLFVVLNLLLISVGAYQGVGLFYQFVEERLDQTAAASYTATISFTETSTPAARPPSDYQAIASRNLFRTRATSQSRTQKPAIENLTETKLDLRLWGTVTANVGRAFAVIQEAGRQTPQKLYHVGDRVKEATIVRILREKVVLDVDGQNEVLALQKLSSSNRGRAPSRRSSRPKVVQRRTIPRKTIDTAMANLNKLVTQARVRPHTKGLIIDHIKPNSLFRRLGLRNGDILVGIEGQPIRTVDEALVFYDRLQNADRLSVDLLRRGRAREMQFRIR
jgi:general secretion pathway protein C